MNNKKQIIIIGGGINGLVAANYLQRHKFQVTLLERKKEVGGACSFDTLTYNTKQYRYANGATMLGMMQDFIFKETGLDKYLQIYCSDHPEIIYFESDNSHCLFYDEIRSLTKELKEKWNEQGNLKLFFEDFEKIRAFLIRGFRKARVPTLQQANKELGKKLTSL